ncbi:MAG TPA: class I tRNA ligase family protein, partial [Anaerolineales bacterium]|nr:class I tRNA ligase family protein [Anaerolineales bacterium]
MTATKKKETRKKTAPKKSTIEAAKKIVKAFNTMNTSSPQGKKVAVKKAVKATTPKSKAKKIAVKKPAARKAVKAAPVKKVAKTMQPAATTSVTPKKVTSKSKAIQVATSKAIQPVKNMAIMVPPTPSRKAIVSIKPEPAKAKAVTDENLRQDKSYNPQTIEKKWQDKWEADKLYRSVIDKGKPKHYALTMLPYPSGDLHIGHWYAMTPSDARARYMRMRGYNVLFPMGFDAFGLPAENAAIKDGVHPMKRTFENIEKMRRQMKSMGTMFDWEREAISASPEYYKWTEWFFIQLFKAGLAYRKMSAVDWCPNCNTTLA